MNQPSVEYAHKVFLLLEKHYPKAKMILEWENNFELLVAIILSAQCTDTTVNKVTQRVFPKYKQPRKELERKYTQFENDVKLPKEQLVEIVNFSSVPLTELEQDIKSTGFYKNKAKNVQSAAKVTLEKFLGNLPKTIKELTTIPGVGRKTANVFLGNAYHITEGIAVDTHVQKQAQLLNLTQNSDPDKIEQDLMRLYEKKYWFKLTYLLIEHGRNMRRKNSEKITCNEKACILCN